MIQLKAGLTIIPHEKTALGPTNFSGRSLGDQRVWRARTRSVLAKTRFDAAPGSLVDRDGTTSGPARPNQTLRSIGVITR